jgi:hypothetical protein
MFIYCLHKTEKMLNIGTSHNRSVYAPPLRLLMDRASGLLYSGTLYDMGPKMVGKCMEYKIYWKNALQKYVILNILY